MNWAESGRPRAKRPSSESPYPPSAQTADRAALLAALVVPWALVAEASTSNAQALITSQQEQLTPQAALLVRAERELVAAKVAQAVVARAETY